MAWNVPGRCDTEKAAAAFLRSQTLFKVKIEGVWFTREEIAAKLDEWAGARIGAAEPTKGPSPEYRELLDASDARDL
jgi:hypothetical protein